MALKEAYADFEDKHLMTAKEIILREIKKNAAFDNDKLFRKISGLQEKLFQSADIREETAWKQAIKRNEHQLDFLIPTSEDYLTKQEEGDSNEDEGDDDKMN